MDNYGNFDLNELTEHWLFLEAQAKRMQAKADDAGLALIRRFQSVRVLGADTDTHRVTLHESGSTLTVTRLEDL